MRALAWMVGGALGAALLAAVVLYALQPGALPPGAGAQPGQHPPAHLARGEYLMTVAGCANCHNAPDPKDDLLAGGRKLASPFGTFYAPNITPDVETGIGGWTLAAFERALRRGVAPDGRAYYPAFPYTSYTHMNDADVRALFDYLQSVPAVRRPNQDHDLVWYLNRLAMVAWQRLFFQAGEFTPASDRSSQWNRGAYLVTALGHCTECHTPRTPWGSSRDTLFLAGNPEGPDGDAVPNITSSEKFGIGDWSKTEFEDFFRQGMLPDGDFTGGAMTDVVDNSLSALSDPDLEALIAYLTSVPPIDRAP